MNTTKRNNQHVERNNKHTTKRRQQRKKKKPNDFEMIQRFYKNHSASLYSYTGYPDTNSSKFFFEVIKDGVKSYAQSIKAAVMARLPDTLYQYIMFPSRTYDD
jgi:hypothetical protein